MFPQSYNMDSARVAASNNVSKNNEASPSEAREKIMSYEEKAVGSTQFFKCEACPYMAFAEDDIKFHLFTEHPDLAKRNGLADNIQIVCPGCTDSFSAEDALRSHLRNHHKMGIKDVKKMVKSLVQIALKHAKLKKDVTSTPPQDNNQPLDVRIPQVIEIPDQININPNLNNNESLPKGVAFISVDELNRMSTPNFEQVDPKEIIQEASINIVYTNEVAQYANVTNSISTSSCSMIQVSSVTPDLISSIQPRTNQTTPQQCMSNLETNLSPVLFKNGHPKGSVYHQYINNTNSNTGFSNSNTLPISLPARGRPKTSGCHQTNTSKSLIEPSIMPESTDEMEHQPLSLKNKGYEDVQTEQLGILCGVNKCNFRMKSTDKLAYHKKCHRSDGKLICLEGNCTKVCSDTEALHTHLWKIHAVDMELPTCEVCGFKTYKKYRLLNIHMKIHRNLKAYMCYVCSKTFKTAKQLSRHKTIHKKVQIPVQCTLCHLEFSCESRLSQHTASVHDKYRPYKCDICEFTAAKKEDVKLHARSHTGEKPYLCDVCEFKCADHNSMRRHKKQHSKEQPYKCKHCPYTSIQSTKLANHMIIKHPTINTDLHKCPYCRFKSLNREKYVLHLTTHTDKEGIQLLIEMTKEKAKLNSQKPNWTVTVPSDTDSQSSNQDPDKIVPNWTVNLPDSQNSQEINITKPNWTVTLPSQTDSQNGNQELPKTSIPNWMITIPTISNSTQNISQELSKSSKPNWMITIPSTSTNDIQNIIQEPSNTSKPNWMITIPTTSNNDTQNINQEPYKTSKPNWITIPGNSSTDTQNMDQELPEIHKPNWITIPGNSSNDTQHIDQEPSETNKPNWMITIPSTTDTQSINQEPTNKPNWMITIPCNNNNECQTINQDPPKPTKPNWMITIPSNSETQTINQESSKPSKPNWMITIPSNKVSENSSQENTINKPWSITMPNHDTQNETQEVTKDHGTDIEQNQEVLNTIDVETYECDSLSENIPQDYSKTCTSSENDIQESTYSNYQGVVQDLSKGDNNSDCLISESSNDTMMERPQYSTQMPLQLTYNSSQSNIYLPNVSMNHNLMLQNSTFQSGQSVPLSTSLTSISNNMTNLLNNFPIRLPPAPQTVSNNITLTPVDKISNPLTTKITGIIKPTQILPVPSSSNSPPVNFSTTDDGAPRKKPKISVKSNLILKGPDRVNMFHSQQKMAFRQLQDSERFGCPVTFNNLITTQLMQLQPEPVLRESPNNILPYQEPMLEETSTPPVDTEINENPQIFTFNQQMNVNQILLPPAEKIQTTDPSYIKLEGAIKQNTQSPSLERMCNAHLLTNSLTHQYKASPPLEEMNKNMSEIKNEVKSDYYNQNIINEGSTSMIDQYLIDNIIGEQYTGHLDLSAVVLPEVVDDQQNDVIEIDENSDDTKMMPRFDMNYLEPLYLMHNDFHFLDHDNLMGNNPEIPPVSEMNRMVSEVPLPSESIDIPSEGSNQDFPNFIEGKKDPMMNTSVRPTTNKINVKNIELMKN